MISYSWAGNLLKLQRAYDAARGGSEDLIKQKYVELGGLLINQPAEEKVTNIDKLKIVKKEVAPVLDAELDKGPDDKLNPNDNDSSLDLDDEVKVKVPKSKKSSFDS